MIEAVFSFIVSAAIFYVACGLLVAAVFLTRWCKSFDPSAAEGTWGFRLLIVPGIVALWPVVLAKVRAIHRGRSAAGDAERPVAAETLRRNHYRSIVALAIVGTLIFIIALMWRAPQFEDIPPSVPVANLNTR